jgi:hypothetical protein
MIEIMSFRLAPEADEEAFLAADRLVQSDFAYHQPGLLRRTTARSADGAWIVIDLWRSESDADATAVLWGGEASTSTFMSFVDPTTVRTERYTTLD